MKLYGLMITKDDHEIFADWCRDQLALYDAVVCLDGSSGEQTERIAAGYPDRLVYLHERDFDIPHKTDHGLRRVVHCEIVRRFGDDNWVMCCHVDEFCYHAPRKVADRAAAGAYGAVAWFSLQFVPHPDELADWRRLSRLPVPERMRHYHWNHRNSGLPWVEHRLYRNGPRVQWDGHTHGSVCPHNVGPLAPFHPSLCHYKVVTTDLNDYERGLASTYYRSHWAKLEQRTGLSYRVDRFEDFFTASYPGYARCDRFGGTIPHSWNMGEQYRPNAPNSDRRPLTLPQCGEEAHFPPRGCVSPAPDSSLTDFRAQNSALLETDAQPGSAQPFSSPHPTVVVAPCRPGKVAVLSFLFNWPSTGGGIFHTVELVQFLAKAGYQVQHFYPCYPGWGIGCVTAPVPFPSQPLAFDAATWNVPWIQQCFRQAVDSFEPDQVIITDSWNMKPHLAEAVRGYPYILRFQAMECLCPLNGVRLLAEAGGRFRQCPQHQLATPEACNRCLVERGHQSGRLHQLDRALSGVGDANYHGCLVRALRGAEAVLVVNPLQEAMLSPYAANVRVVPSGFDPARFPWPWPDDPVPRTPGKVVFLFAGIVEEPIKGFAVLHQACSLLWQNRHDFELVATGDPAGPIDAFTRFIGWQSQQDLPRQLRAADVLVMPTIAQEALGRTAVEAMAVGRPVVASRLGGLPFTVPDGATGLLSEPGDVQDLAAKLERLLDDPELRHRLGLAGRRRFEEHYDWSVIIDRHYRPLLSRTVETGLPAPAKGAGDTASLRGAGQRTYAPYLPARVDQRKLLLQLGTFFQVGLPDLEAKLAVYGSMHEAKGYAERLGERKTLCFEEAFSLYVLIQALRPRTIVEIGTQHGKSTRRLIDIKNLLGLNTRIVTFDLTNQVEHFDSAEAELVLQDVTGRFGPDVLQAYRPELLFLDVHAYPLLKEILAHTLTEPSSCAVAVHDCAPGLCNPRMTLNKDDPAITSSTGVWERHVLAEVLGVDDPLSERLAQAETEHHRVTILDTPHGLGLIVPKTTTLAFRQQGSAAARATV